ncbi:MAG: TonB-dependent receptor [Betaproteobacteria bacterium]|nr:TonB-dependent receptor [Betaproteobacteria bacterium]
MKRGSIALALLAASGTALAADPSPAQLKEVTVTATSDTLAEQHEAVSQKTVIDRKEIEALGGLTVGEVIRKLPGIEAGEHGADGGMSARVRGMSRDAVQFLVNGERPTANARFALTQVGRMPSGELERIEILRGGSAEFGGAAAVTVNLVMRQPTARASTTLKLAAGQRGPETNAQASFSRGGGEGSFSWLVPVTLNRHAMPVDLTLQRDSTLTGQQRETEHGDYAIDEFILAPRLSWRKGADVLSLWPSYYHNTGERATRMARDTGDTRVDSEDNSIRIARLRAEGEMRLGESKLSGRAAVMSGRRHVDRDRHAQNLGVPTIWKEAERRQDSEFSGSLRIDRPVGMHFLSSGVDYAQHRREDRQAFSGAITSATTFDGDERHWALWVQDEWALRPGLTTTLGLRGETMQIETNGGSRRHGAVDPALALRWEPAAGWVARTSLSGAIRFPKLEELTAVATLGASANTPLEPDRGGNPALKPERIANLEAGLERHLADGVLGVNAYWRRTQDFVERRTALEGARWVDRPANEGDARHWGLELSAKLKGNGLLPLPKDASLRAHLTLPRGEVKDARLGADRPVRDLPRYTFSLSYEDSLPAWQSTWGIHWSRNGKVETDVPGELAGSTPRRDLIDMHVVRRLDAQLNLRLSLQNHLGTDTRRFASAWSGGNAWQLDSVDAGQRTWLLSLEGKW